MFLPEGRDQFRRFLTGIKSYGRTPPAHASFLYMRRAPAPAAPSRLRTLARVARSRPPSWDVVLLAANVIKSQSYNDIFQRTTNVRACVRASAPCAYACMRVPPAETPWAGPGPRHARTHARTPARSTHTHPHAPHTPAPRNRTHMYPDRLRPARATWCRLRSSPHCSATRSTRRGSSSHRW